MRLFTLLLILLSFSVALPRLVYAGYEGPLTKQEIDAFLAVGYQLGEIADEMEKEGVRSFLVPRADNIATYIMDMEHQNIVELKENHPEYYARAQNVAVAYQFPADAAGNVGGKPFGSLEEWARSSDRVLMTYFAINRGEDEKDAKQRDAQKELAEKMKLLPPGFLDMLPEEGRKKLENAVGAEKRLNEVSSEDILVVQESKDEIGVFLFEYIHRRSLK